MIKGAVFDIDGTLIDSMPIWEELGVRYLKGQGIRAEENLAEILFPMTIAEGVLYLKNHYGLPGSPEEIRQGLTEITDAFYRYEVKAKAGVRQALDMLRERGIPMALATIGDPDLEEAALRRLGIWDYFDHMLVCEDYHTTKKEAVIYRAAAGKLGTVPEETLVFEDVYQAVHAAARDGFFVCAVADDASRADRDRIMQEADLFLEDFRQFHKIERLLEG